MDGADVEWVLKGTGNLSRGTGAAANSAGGNSLGGDTGSRVSNPVSDCFYYLDHPTNVASVHLVIGCSNLRGGVKVLKKNP